MLIRIRDYTISDITDSIRLLLDRAAHSPEVRQLAIQITYDSQDKIASVYDWIKNNMSYIPDSIGAGGVDIELFISPVKMIKDYEAGLRPGGDCDDMAMLATALCRAIGIRSNVIIIDSIGNGFDHAYSQAYSDKLKAWINCDTSSNYPLGWEYPYKGRIVVE